MFLIEISGEQAVAFAVSCFDDVLLRHRTHVRELHECPLGGNRLHCEFTKIDRAWAREEGENTLHILLPPTPFPLWHQIKLCLIW